MITRKLNERICLYSLKTGKDENGDLVKKETKLFECWAEVAKSTTKEFRDRSNNFVDGLEKQRERRVFYIRFRTDFDTDDLVYWRSKKYQIIEIEDDWQSKDMLMISVEVIK